MVRRFLSLLALIFLLALSARGAHAQVVRGTFLSQETRKPIQGAFIILVDTTGKELAGSLTGPLGEFRIQAPDSGTYRLRWELVGRPVDYSEPFQLFLRREIRIALHSSTQPRVLGAVEVSGASSCPMTPNAAELSSLWVEVTKVLRVAEWSVGDQRLLFDVETVQRTWDASFEKVESELREVYEGRTRRPFATVDPEFLSEYGYFVMNGREQHYFAPDEKSLLHDSFISQHCLSFAASPKGLESLIGIGFTPSPDRYRPDISGVFWLDRESLMLRAIDFRFSGLQQFAMHDALGGRMEFDRLSSGEWYIARWSMRMPVVTLCRGTGLLGFLTPKTRPCLQQIVEAAGEVFDVRHSGIERDERLPLSTSPREKRRPQ